MPIRPATVKLNYGKKMTSNPQTLLAFASWEDRFSLGVLKDLNNHPCDQIVVFFFSTYADRTLDSRDTVRTECHSRDVKYDEIELDPTLPHGNLRVIHAAINRFRADAPIVVDISTMPREVIWYIFWISEERPTPLRYCYHSPRTYSDDWLSRDPGRPRLVHKLSGIALPQARTALLVAVGYDIQRVSQLIRFFEPSKLLIALQGDSPFPANDDFMRRYVDELRVSDTCTTFPIDAFGDDHGYRSFYDKLNGVVDDHNVILSSLGPKLTAISLYLIRRQWPQVGLVYAPASEFNTEYSRGIGKSFQGTLPND